MTVVLLAGVLLALGTVLQASAAPIDRTTSLISLPTGVPDPDGDGSSFGRVSADGTRVFMLTFDKLTADDLDTNRSDIYERSGGTTTLVSAPTGVADPDEANPIFEGISADGTRAFFRTSESLTTDDNDNQWSDIYERSGGTTTLVSAPTGVADPDTEDVAFAGASADGTRVFFETSQTMTADDADVGQSDVYERSGGTTTLVSKPTGVTDPNANEPEFVGASADGTRVFFVTNDALTADDSDTDLQDVYERSAGTTTLLSQPTGVTDPDSDDVSFEGASADGTRVLFGTSQKMTGADGDTDREDVYERSGGTTTLVSAPTGVTDPNTANADFRGASADATRVFFQTSQQMTTDDNDTGQEDVYERSGGTTTLVSAPTGVPAPTNAHADFRAASADGTRVFLQTALKLTADDNDTSLQDVFERSGGTTTLVSAPTGVADPDTADDVTFRGISQDGTRVFFSTTKKMTGDDNDTSWSDVYERAGGTTTLVTGPTGVADPGTAEADFGGASADGTRVFFRTTQKLTADDNDTGKHDVYMAADISVPDTTITDAPPAMTNDPTPSFSFSSSEADSTFECSVDGAPFAACTSPTTLAALPDGLHSFQVRARDNAGNLDPSPASGGFTVDTSSPFVPPGTTDTSAPQGKLSGKKTQKLSTSVAVTVACLDESCQAAASAGVSVPIEAAKRFQLKRANAAIPQGGSKKLKLKLSRKARKAIRAALRKGRKVRVKVKVTLTDAAGNQRVLRRTVKLKL